MRSPLPAGVLIVLAGLAAYYNSFRGVFLFDDVPAILASPSVTKGPSLRKLLSGQAPVVTVTLAANYALGGSDVWGYHAFNLAVHLLAGLTLFAIARRTLLSAGLRERFARASTGLALAVAMLWMLHPVHTQAVTYIIQRRESLMGLLYLLTLYFAIRGHDSRRRAWWHAAAVAACLLGMRTKQVTVTAPLIVLLYDRTFLSGSFRRALRRSWPLYALLAATWAVLLHGSASWLERQGFGTARLSQLEYARTQFGVVLHYLRLSVWPEPLCMDYGWPVARTVGQVLPPAVAIAALVGLTAWALWRRPAWGFLGAWFLVIIAPTSSIIVITDLAFEHRMYLPLAGVVALAVMGGYLLCGALVRPRWLRPREVKALRVGLAAAVALSMGYLTVRRNRDYHSEVGFWQDNVRKRPQNARAYVSLGTSCLKPEVGDLRRAERAFTRAVELDPNLAQAYSNLATVYGGMGDHRRALRLCNRAIELEPQYVRAYYNRGAALYELGHPDMAIRDYTKAIELAPEYPHPYHGRAVARYYTKDYAGAWADIRAYRELGKDPDPKLLTALRQASGRSE
ncbi:MAG: tetratricopeptide repeat protein [Phycisphaerae bacterium]